MRKDDVAIIGSAGIFPAAEDLETFHANLLSGRECVTAPGEDRVRSGDDDPGERYLNMGYLDRIDLFDHELFGLTRREAEQMDPHQRLLVQLTHQAIESAGYAPTRLRGAAASVMLAAIDPGAAVPDADRDVETMLGTSTAALAARIAYLFDLQGPALVVDTACSSGLTALSLAVRQVRGREVPFAVVGAVNVFPRLVRSADWIPMQNLESTDGRCRPFDAGANGLAAGEGGGVLVLKLLSEAVADGDNVLAVLKGIAVNHNGFRAASMAAPSQLGQANVMTQAWRDGDVDADSIGYVECHGSGTPLGDVVEVEALNRAFADAGGTGRECAISSVKANIGHLGNTAGLAGLFKVMSALRHGTLYPAVNFTEPNPLIDFSGPVYVNTEARPWPSDATGPRRAGVSSWGLTGTNVHAVLEQAPVLARRTAPGGPRPELVTVSAKSAAALDRYRTRLAEFAETTDQPLRAVAHVLNRGRDDHPYRLAVTAGGTGELAERLRTAAVPERPCADAPRVVLLFSGDALLDDAVWRRLLAEFPVPAECEELDAAAEPAGRLVARQYALYRVAETLGLTNVALVGSGAGNLTVRVVRGTTTLAAAVTEAAATPLAADPDPARLKAAVTGFVRDGALLVEMAPGGVLAREIGGLAPELPLVDLVVDGSRAGVLGMLGRLYALGAPLDWDRHYRDVATPRIEAPTYPFEPTRCRITAPRPAATNPAPAAAPAPAAPADLATIERRVAEVWSELLEQRDVGPDSDYFMLGGTSLVGVGMLRRLQQSFGVEVTFADLYAHHTVRALAARLHALAAERGETRDAEPIALLERGGPLPLSPGQEALWYLDQINPGSPLYNVPTPMHLVGPLDEAALQDALVDMAERHETLRSVFLTDDGGVPYLLPTAIEPLLSVVNLSRLPAERRGERVRALIRQSVSIPFDLTRDTPVRAMLVRLAEEEHVLVLTYHHIVFDGGSQPLFGRDLGEFYRARSTGTEPRLPELPVQYQDYAAWHRALLAGPRLERGLEFWRAELDGLTRPELPLDHPRPERQSYAGDMITFVVDAELAERVRDYSRRNGVTTFVTMLAALDSLLHLWTGHTDVVVGVATSGRIHPDVQDLIGYFNSIPPFRTGMSGDLPFDEIVRRCATTVAGVLDHEEIPLNRIIAAGRAPRDLARHPLYDVTYTYQNVPRYEPGMGALESTRFVDTEVGGTVPGTAKFDLTFALVDAGAGPMDGELEYATSLFDRSTAERLARWFPALVAAVMAEPDLPLAEIGPEAASAEGPAPAPAPEPLPPAAEPASAAAPSPAAERAREVLLRLFGELMESDEVGADDDFFALGGDSVISIRLAAQARRHGVRISQQQVFELRTPAAMAAAATVDPPQPSATAPAVDPATGATPQPAGGLTTGHPAAPPTAPAEGLTAGSAVDPTVGLPTEPRARLTAQPAPVPTAGPATAPPTTPAVDPPTAPATGGPAQRTPARATAPPTAKLTAQPVVDPTTGPAAGGPAQPAEGSTARPAVDRLTASAAGGAARPAVPDAARDPENVPARGSVPLTPAMRDFVERAGAPGRFTQSVVVTTPAGADHATLTAAVRAVAGCHEMLRARLVAAGPVADPGTWSLTLPADPDEPPAVEVSRVDATGLDAAALDDLAGRERQAAAGRLDPWGGELARFVWLDRGPATAGRLVAVVHHLVVDVLSWPALLADLAGAYAALAAGRPAVLPPVRTSFARWARALAAHAEAPARRLELPVWQRTLAPGAALLGGRELDPARDTAGNGRAATARVPAAVTARLLADAPAALRAGTGDLLLAALAAAVAERQAARGAAREPVVVEVESHGREPLTDDMDLSRTVGWFTGLYPVRLDPGPVDLAEARAGGPAAGEIVRRIRDQLAVVPGNGLGFGALRHLNAETRETLAALPAPTVGFNYLGELPGAGPAPEPAPGDPEPPWRLLETDGDVAETTPFAHALEASGVVRHDGPEGPEFDLSLFASRHLVDEAELRALCEAWVALLTGLARHACPEPSGTDDTPPPPDDDDRPGPGDFPLVSLSQSQIDLLEAEYGA
ncbi:condensation domain-containing protein [Streptomyces sp. B6B3]|uniref:condensation domain-containing protein n=1 Tax=Streptomyces sp. B6B3 TaxID=3153570 RepID=UPI00325C83D3